VAIKRDIGQTYNSLLSGIRGVTTPVEKSWATNMYWMYGILVDESFGMSRDELRNFLAAKGVETRTFFVPMHQQPAFLNRDMFVGESHPVSEKLSREGLYLPSGMTLTKQEIRYVVECVKEAKEKAN
jgi:perosamine synthetase